MFLHWYSSGFIVHRGCFFSPFYRGPANPVSGLLVNSILVFVSCFPVVFDTVTCHRHQWYFSSATFHLGFLIMSQFVVSRFHGYDAEVMCLLVPDFSLPTSIFSRPRKTRKTLRDSCLFKF